MIKKWRKLGDWTPAHLNKADCTVLVITVVVLGLLRAYDYVIGNDNHARMPVKGRPPAVSLLADAFPLRYYGYALIFATVVLVLGTAFRNHRVVWLGHGLCMVSYLVLFVGTVLPILSTPYLDGLRGATALLGPMLIHGLFWLRTGPKPINTSHIDDRDYEVRGYSVRGEHHA